MSLRQEQIGIKTLLELASQSREDYQFDTAKQFARRALTSAEALQNVEWEIRSRFMLMECCSYLGEDEEAIGHATILLEFLYTPDALKEVDDPDQLLALILRAFPTTVLACLSSRAEDAAYGKPELLDRLLRVVNEGFHTLERLGKTEGLQALYFVRGQIASYRRDYEAALQDHERAWALTQRVPEGRWLDLGSIETALASAYSDLDQTEEAQRRFRLIVEDESYNLTVRVTAGYHFALEILNQGKVAEAEVVARQTLQLVREIESPRLRAVSSVTLFEVLLEAGKGASIIGDAVQLVRFMRRFRTISSFVFLRQVVFSQCGEIRVQQVLSECGLPIGYESVAGRLPPLSSPARRRCLRITRQAIRWFNRVTAFEKARDLDFAQQLLTSLMETESAGDRNTSMPPEPPAAL